MEYSKGRKAAAAVGVTLILASASGGTSVMNAIVPFLLEGMQVSLTTFMLGPTIATILSFAMSAVGETLKKGASIYCFLIAMFVVAWCASGITSYASVYYTSFGMAATTAAAMLSVYSFTAAVLKLASGFIIKKIGAKAMSLVIYLGFALGIVCLLIWSQTQIMALAIIGIVFCAFISYATMIPGLFVPDLYGMKDYTDINSAGVAGYYAGAVTVLLGLSIVIGILGYFNAFVVLAVAAVVAMAFMLVAVATSPIKKAPQEAVE